MVRLSSLARTFGLAALFALAAIAGTAAGVLFAFSGDLPQISALDDYSPSTITRVLARDQSLVGEFATERRVVVAYDQIPQVLRDALVAAEDANFYRHSGVDLTATAATVIRRLTGMQRRGGASTITQQLTRMLLLSDEVTAERTATDGLMVIQLERKVKEWLLAVQIEKRYTKKEILTMFCNKMYWGHGAYGVEAASQLYFGKSVKDLTLEEAAMIAGIHQSNVRQSPYVNMKAALSRRNYALTRMRDEGFITETQFEEARGKPIVTRGQPSQPASMAPYFLETIRTHLEEAYGGKALYEHGLVVRTGLDPALQQAANRALDDGLRQIDRARGFRAPARNLVRDGRSIDTYKHPRWTRDPVQGDVQPAIVMGVSGDDIRVRVGRFAGTVGKTGYAWTRKRPEALVRVGDLVEVRVLTLDGERGTLTAQLEQPPLVEGAVLAVDNHTGEILAMIGGQSFERSQFNRATQAMRQVGSLFKPFVYTAAIDRGYTAQSIIDDSPVSYNAGPGQPPYQPKNYDREYHGRITLREALEGSRNVPTIRLMAALGPKEVIGYARQLGVTTPIPEYLSVAIGSAESTLLEMVSAYSAYPNQGVRMAPHPIIDVRDRSGTMLEQHRPEPHDAIRADTAYILTTLLAGVVQHGTAASAASLDWPLGGKTGTTDDYTDAWFVGFDPDITVGVWLGLDQKKPIGTNQTGASAALPIWKSIMASWIDRRRATLPAPPEFPRPGNIVTVGTETFIAGTQPGAGRAGESAVP